MKCASRNVLAFAEKNVHVLIGDQANASFWREKFSDGSLPERFDLVLDDGGHQMDGQARRHGLARRMGYHVVTMSHRVHGEPCRMGVQPLLSHSTTAMQVVAGIISGGLAA
jgi:hypothetical protein